MSLARILSRTQLGLEASLVPVELQLGRGLPGFAIVGVPAPVVREGRERVHPALLNCGDEFPAGRITVKLASAELSKQRGRIDLPIALGLLIASGQPPPRRAFEWRRVHRLLRLGRTIADLAGSELIEPPHLAEAIQLRRPLPWDLKLRAYCASETM